MTVYIGYFNSFKLNFPGTVAPRCRYNNHPAITTHIKSNTKNETMPTSVTTCYNKKVA